MIFKLFYKIFIKIIDNYNADDDDDDNDDDDESFIIHAYIADNDCKV